MTILLIAALGKKFVIGNKGYIPWHLPADLEHFRKLTLGKPIIMGRTTFESIGKVLPGRKNIVLTRNRSWDASGVVVVHSVKEALVAASGAPEIMVIGGAEIYELFLPLARNMYLTFVEGEFKGDAYFPKFDQSEWKEIKRESHKADQKNPHPYIFVTLKRK